MRGQPAVIITPISRKADVDYKEQLNLQEQGQSIKWDDSRYNKSQPGDLCVFSFHNKKAEIRVIDKVLPHTERPQSWAAKERNVLILSDWMCRVPWVEWLAIGGPTVVMGTQSLKKNLSSIVEHARSHMATFCADQPSENGGAASKCMPIPVTSPVVSPFHTVTKVVERVQNEPVVARVVVVPPSLSGMKLIFFSQLLLEIASYLCTHA
jgi:hypothetical protein